LIVRRPLPPAYIAEFGFAGLPQPPPSNKPH
jgi:hypothetical protein